MADRPDTPAAGGIPPWLSRLSAVDRRVALRLLSSPGETCLRRILQAMGGKRPAGRPEAAVPAEWLERAALLYVTRDGLQPGDAAGLVANELLLSGGIMPGSRNSSRRKISEALRPHANALTDATVGSLSDTFLWKVGVQAQKDGHRLRKDLFPLLAARADVDRTMLAFRRHLSPFQAVRVPRLPHLRQEPVAVMDAQAERFLAFLKAFADVLPMDAPASEGRRMFEDVRRFIADEAAARGASAEPSGESAETP